MKKNTERNVPQSNNIPASSGIAAVQYTIGANSSTYLAFLGSKSELVVGSYSEATGVLTTCSLPPDLAANTSCYPPSLAVFNGSLFLAVAYQVENNGNPAGEIYICKSSGSSIDFSSPMAVNQTIPVTNIYIPTQIYLVSFSDKLYLFFPTDNGNLQYIYTKDGVTWSESCSSQLGNILPVAYMNDTISPGLSCLNFDPYVFTMYIDIFTNLKEIPHPYISNGVNSVSFAICNSIYYICYVDNDNNLNLFSYSDGEFTTNRNVVTGGVNGQFAIALITPDNQSLSVYYVDSNNNIQYQSIVF
jgi:hypothetical protein